MKKNLTTEEKLKAISDSPELWLKNFVKITNNEGELINFVLNDQQREFIQTMEKYNIISKARQIGFTTLSLALCLYYACTRPRTNYLIVSYKAESSVQLFDKLKQMNADLPREKYPDYFPNVFKSNREQLRFDNGSNISVQTAGRKDIGRGSTYDYILLSEFAFYDYQETVLVGAEQGLAKKHDSRIVIETTSNGFNYYQKLFMNAYKRHSKYRAYFFPWFSSAYKNQFKAEYIEAEKWYKTTNKGLRLAGNDLKNEELELHKQGATLGQLMWREWKLTDMSLQQFHQEFPSNPMESFISTGNSVFNQEKLSTRLAHVPEPLKNIDNIIPNSFLKYLGRELKVFHLPKKTVSDDGTMKFEKYYGGVDTASGSGGDYSTISIIDSEGNQVFSFADNRIPVYEFAELLNVVGHFYNYAYLVVERQGFGIPILERLRKEYEYMNLHKNKVFDQQRGKTKLQLGFSTTAVTKNIMVSDLKEQFELGMILINDSETLEQMQIFVEKENGATGNKNKNQLHDDLVIAIGLAIQGMKANKWYV